MDDASRFDPPRPCSHPILGFSQILHLGAYIFAVAGIGALRLLLAEIGAKKEKISASKKLVVLSQGDVEDRPADARRLLGLKSGAVQLADTGCGGRDVFVQSTSGNRGLLAGSRMLFEVPFNPAGKKRKVVVAADVAGSQGPDRKRLKEEDPDRAGRPPLVVEWMDRVDVDCCRCR